MSGHSHWSSIKRQKGAADAKRGQVFTKIAKEISAAARAGGGDPAGNIRLRMAIQKGKDNNMPGDNIDRAVKRGSGEDGADNLLEVTYEGYAPGGAAVLVQALTDNRNRTVSEVRTMFSHNNGSMAEAGSVTWNFERKGVVVVSGDGIDVDEMAMVVIDAGADDFKEEDGALEVYTTPDTLEEVRSALEEHGANIASSEAALVPKTTVQLDAKTANQTMRLLEGLEDLDDVQQVFTNADFPDDDAEE